MTDIARLDISPRASRVVVHKGIAYLAGSTAADRTQDIRGQTHQALEKIDRYLAEVGTDKANLLTAQIWIRDIANDFEGMNDVWDAWTAPGATPTRATAQCDMAQPDILVEITVSAAIPD